MTGIVLAYSATVKETRGIMTHEDIAIMSPVPVPVVVSPCVDVKHACRDHTDSTTAANQSPHKAHHPTTIFGDCRKHLQQTKEGKKVLNHYKYLLQLAITLGIISVNI